MAETSGFFNAEMSITGAYDREYVAEQWADYFKLFIGNGVFVSPTNQIKVQENSGLTVKVLPGWAWINGYWYHNDANLILNIPVNATAQSRIDGIFIRFDSNSREISIVVGQGRTTVIRTNPYYELKIAEVTVTTGASSITNSVITDTRADSNVCGFVTGVVDVIDSGDLFDQFTAIFNSWISEVQEDYDTWIEEQESSFESWYQTQTNDFDDWFDHMKDQLSSDAAGHLQLEIDDIYEKLAQTAHPVTISVTTPPIKTTYNHGEVLDLTGIVVRALYSDNHTENITSQCTFSPANGATLSDTMTAVTVSWTWVLQDLNIHYTTTQAITVNRVLSSIAITTPPTKSIYEIEESLNTAGCVVTATYSSGSTSDVTSGCTFTPSNGTTLETEGTIPLTASYTEGGLTKTASTNLTVNPAVKIYGVEWNGLSSPAMTRTDQAVNFVDPVAAVNNGNGSSPFDTIQPWAGMERVVDSNAGVLVKIPKFYFKLSTTNAGAFKLQIIPAMYSTWALNNGYKVSPAHMDRGDGKGERDYVYVGAYDCSISDYRSTSGVKPATNITRAAFRTNIHNLGSDIWQWDIAMYKTIEMLYIVEYANWNSQLQIGAGGTASGSVENSGATDAMTYHTGTSVSTKNKKGQTRYRYIENLWGNCMDFIDGIYSIDIDNKPKFYTILNPSNFSDNSNGVDTGISVYGNGRINKFKQSETQNCEWFYWPIEISDNGVSYSEYVCDHIMSGYSSPIVTVGGGNDYDTKYGLFRTYLSPTFNQANSGRTSRLQKLP